MNEPVTVLLVDDHPLVRRGVSGYLAAQPDIEVVAEAGSASEALNLAREHTPDVALVDLVMPGGHGVGLIRDLAKVSPGTRVVVLTSYQDDRHLLPAMHAGAISYLLKDVSPGELAAAVRKAAAGEAVLHPAVADRVLTELRVPGTASQLQQLSSRELEVLRLVAAGWRNTQIAQQLYISEKTVKSHVSSILAKLHLADRTQATAYAWRQGIIDP